MSLSQACHQVTNICTHTRTHTRTHERTHVHTHARIQKETDAKKKKLDPEQMDVIMHMCPHTTICVLILLYIRACVYLREIYLAIVTKT